MSSSGVDEMGSQNQCAHATISLGGCTKDLAYDDHCDEQHFDEEYDGAMYYCKECKYVSCHTCYKADKARMARNNKNVLGMLARKGQAYVPRKMSNLVEDGLIDNEDEAINQDLLLNPREIQYAEKNADRFSKMKDFGDDEWLELLEESKQKHPDWDGERVTQTPSLDLDRMPSGRSPSQKTMNRVSGRGLEPHTSDNRYVPPIQAIAISTPPGTPRNGTLAQRLPSIEARVFGKVRNGNLGTRVQALEKEMFGELAREGQGLKPRLARLEQNLEPFLLQRNGN